MANSKPPQQKDGQRLALVIAGVGIFWVLANVIGSQLGLSNRIRALIDLSVLALFAWAIWRAVDLWRNRK